MKKLIAIALFLLPTTAFSLETVPRSPTVSDGSGWVTPDNAFTSNDVYATGITASQQKYSTFTFTLTSTTTIVNGIKIIVEGAGLGANSPLNLDLSYNAGTNWSSTKSNTILNGADANYTYGSSTDTWGRTWVYSDFSDPNFRVRLTNGGANAINVDNFTVTVYSQIFDSIIQTGIQTVGIQTK